MILLVVIIYLAIGIFPLPFIDTDFVIEKESHNAGIVMFTIMGVLFGL